MALHEGSVHRAGDEKGQAQSLLTTDGKPPSLLAMLTRQWAVSGGHGFSSKGKVGFCARERPQYQEEGGGERASVTDTSGPPTRVRPGEGTGGRPLDPCTPHPLDRTAPK